MDSNVTFHQYVRDSRRRKRGIIVVTVNKSTGSFDIGWSLCSKRDYFDVSIGYDIAKVRMSFNSGVNLRSPEDQQRIIDQMPDCIADAWLYGGVYNRAMQIMYRQPTEDAANEETRVPISRYIGNEESSFYSASLIGNKSDFDRDDDSHYTNNSGRIVSNVLHSDAGL